MYLKIFILALCNLFYLNSFAQIEDKCSLEDFTKYIEKNYRTNNEIWEFCNKNYSIVYFDIDKNNKIEKIYGDDDLGNLLTKNLGFSLNHTIKDLKINKKTIGIFFILKNTNANCVDIKNGYNSTSFIIENLFTQISKKQNSSFFIWKPIILITPNPIK